MKVKINRGILSKKVPTVPVLGTFQKSTGLLCQYSVLSTYQIDITTNNEIEALYLLSLFLEKPRKCPYTLHFY